LSVDLEKQITTKDTEGTKNFQARGGGSNTPSELWRMVLNFFAFFVLFVVK